MAEEIVNRVAKSKLVTFNLEDFYPKGPRTTLDISQWLWEGIVLKEKDFRASLDAFNTTSFEGAYVALFCSTEAIVPGWAYMLVALKLSPVAKKVIVGPLEALETILFTELIATIDLSEFKDAPVIIKGCSHYPIPPNAYTLLAQKLQPYAKSIMYGEACSSVPLYKRR